jgi:hypothetical protein
MKCNVGKTDQILRIILGVVIIGAGLFAQSLWALVGLVPIITGVLKWCPAYLPLGVSTCSTGCCCSGDSCSKEE